MIRVKGYRSGNPNPPRTKGLRSPKENREHPCPSRLVSYHNQQNCRVGISKIRKQNSNRPETSPIVNGGHYMTRGHVILGQLYIKISRMSRTILERKTNPFGRKNGPVPTRFAPPPSGDPIPPIREALPPLSDGNLCFFCHTAPRVRSLLPHLSPVLPNRSP